MYVDLSVSVDPRLEIIGEPILNFVYIKIHFRRHKYVSLAERVILLNLVLNVIPIFFLFFLKLPLKVWNKLYEFKGGFYGEGSKVNLKLLGLNGHTCENPR